MRAGFFISFAVVQIAFVQGSPIASDNSSNEITAVSSKTFAGYKRVILPDGTFKSEKYGFAVGGLFNRSTVGLEGAPPSPTSDKSIEDASFSTVATLLEGPLRDENYIPTDDPKGADLLIVVYWGRTIGSNA
ncbi:MAG TPA: hypothetical protein VGF85_00420, partial [Opitutaceae bacterium]